VIATCKHNAIVMQIPGLEIPVALLEEYGTIPMGRLVLAKYHGDGIIAIVAKLDRGHPIGRRISEHLSKESVG